MTVIWGGAVLEAIFNNSASHLSWMKLFLDFEEK